MKCKRMRALILIINKNVQYIRNIKMKTEDEIRAEFESWCKGRHSLRRNESGFYINDAADFAWEAWESCQQLNDTVIAAKDAEIAMLREELRKIRLYGNNIYLRQLENAINLTLEENGNLADGDDCTLIHLKKVMGVE